MSEPLPEFRAGERLKAAKLNALGGRIRELAAHMPSSGGEVIRPRRVIPCRHYAFELGELSGVLYYRQGWIDPGTGELVQVGQREWNAIGRVQPCTVWLEIAGGPDSCTAEVVQGEYDAVTPESNLRRRLGYVREEKTEDDRTLLHCVQVLGGLICPCAPRRSLGTPTPDDATHYCAHDESWNYCHAGAIQGSGYSVGEDTYSGRVVVLGYSNTVGTVGLPVAHGGDTFALRMSFHCSI